MPAKITDLPSYLEARVERIPECGCWIWMQAVTSNGYGKLNLGKGWQMPHRIAWGAYIGPIPEGMQVLHRCDVRSCCNPYHLRLGTQKDNMQDMMDKRRDRRKDGSRRSGKLSTEQATAIYHDPRFQHIIAAEYGIRQGSVHKIKSGKTHRLIKLTATT